MSESTLQPVQGKVRHKGHYITTTEQLLMYCTLHEHDGMFSAQTGPAVHHVHCTVYCIQNNIVTQNYGSCSCMVPYQMDSMKTQETKTAHSNTFALCSAKYRGSVQLLLNPSK